METGLAQRVLEVVRSEAGEADETTSLEELDLDSLDQLDLVLQIENACAVKFPADLIAGISTVGDIIRAVDALSV